MDSFYLYPIMRKSHPKREKSNFLTGKSHLQKGCSEQKIAEVKFRLKPGLIKRELGQRQVHGLQHITLSEV